jgi:hypothetical protein
MSTYDIRVRLKDSALIPATHSTVVGRGDAPLPVVADGQISVTGTLGLPLITRVGSLLRIEFLRRKATTNSGLTYEPHSATPSSIPGPPPPSPPSTTPGNASLSKTTSLLPRSALLG